MKKKPGEKDFAVFFENVAVWSGTTHMYIPALTTWT